MTPPRFSLFVDGRRFDSANAVLLAHDRPDHVPGTPPTVMRFLFRNQLRGSCFLMSKSVEGEDIQPLSRAQAIQLWNELSEHALSFADAFPGEVDEASLVRAHLAKTYSPEARSDRTTDLAGTTEPSLPPGVALGSQTDSRFLWVDTMQKPIGVTEGPKGEDVPTTPSPLARPCPDAAAAASPVADVNDFPPAAERAAGAELKAQRTAQSDVQSTQTIAVPLMGRRGRHHGQARITPANAPPAGSFPADASASPSVATSHGDPGEAPPETVGDPPGVSAGVSGQPERARDPSAPAELWLDEHGQWQVSGVIRHSAGRLRLVDGHLLVELKGVSGRLRRRPWRRDISISVSTIQSVRISNAGAGLSLLLECAGDPHSLELTQCGPLSTIEWLLDQIRAANGNAGVVGDTAR